MKRACVARKKSKDGKKTVYYVKFERIEGDKVKQVWQRVGTNKKEAQAECDRINDEINKGTFQPAPDITFKEFAEEWEKTHETKVRERTMLGYKGHLKRLTPHFGQYKLRQINPEQIEKFLAELSKEGISPATVGKYLRTLKVVLNTACAWGRLAKNPAQYIKPPKVEKKEFDFYTPAEIATLINASLPEHKALIMTACLTGMRRGELLGLTWDDIDFHSNTIHVRQALFNGKVSQLKSQYSRRKIAMPESLAKELKIHQTRQAVELESNEYNLVFTSKSVLRSESREILRDANGKSRHKGTPMDGHNMVRRIFEPTAKLAELRRIRFHDLRHSFASMLIAQGENIKYIQKVMGHSSIQVTLNVYSHLLPDAGEQAAKRLDDLVFGKVKEKALGAIAL